MVSKRMCRKSRRLALVTGLALIGAAHAVKTVYWRLVNDGFLSAWWAVSEIRFYSDVNCNTDPIEPINVFSSGDLQAGTMGLYPESHSDPEMTGGGGCDAEPMDSRADQNPSCVRQPMPAKSYPAALAFDGNENSWWFSSQTGARTWIGAELQFANSADDLQCVEIKQSGHTRSSTKDLYVQKFLPTKCDTAYASDRCVPSIKMFNLNEAEFNRCFKKVEDADGMFKHWYFDYAACKNVDSSQNSLNAEQDFTTTGAFQFSVNDDQFENLLVNGAIVGVKVVSSPTGEFFNFGDRTITQVTDSSGNTKVLTSLDDLTNFCATHPSNCGSSIFKIAAPTAALNPSGTTGTTSATEVSGGIADTLKNEVTASFIQTHNNWILYQVENPPPIEGGYYDPTSGNPRFRTDQLSVGWPFGFDTTIADETKTVDKLNVWLQPPVEQLGNPQLWPLPRMVTPELQNLWVGLKSMPELSERQLWYCSDVPRGYVFKITSRHDTCQVNELFSVMKLLALFSLFGLPTIALFWERIQSRLDKLRLKYKKSMREQLKLRGLGKEDNRA